MKEIINDCLAVINNWLGVIGFIFTLVTLLIALAMPGKLVRAMNKQKFLLERTEIIKKLSKCCIDIKEQMGRRNEPDNREKRWRILIRAQRQVQKLRSYEIWVKPVDLKIKSFYGALSEYTDHVSPDNDGANGNCANGLNDSAFIREVYEIITTIENDTILR